MEHIMTNEEIEQRIANIEQEVKFLKEQLSKKKQSKTPEPPTEEEETAKVFDFLNSIII